MEILSMKQWSPYIVGGAIGILSWLTFIFSDKPIGCSTAFSRTGGMIERILYGNKVKNKPYYQKFPPTVDWEWMLVIGIFIGAFISAKLSGTFQIQWVPDKWSAHFGNGRLLRLIISLIGGITMGFGARWAGGCTSGHGISGTLQLSVSSWLTVICFFAGGVAMAMILFKLIASV